MEEGERERRVSKSIMRTPALCTIPGLSHVLVPEVARLLRRAGGALQHHVVPGSHPQLLWDAQVAGEAFPGQRQLTHV